MRKVDLASASALARERVQTLAHTAGDEFEVMTDCTKEVEEGWIFFYNTADFVHTKNPVSALAGNGPLLVTRDGAVHQLPSAIPWEVAIRKFRPDRREEI